MAATRSPLIHVMTRAAERAGRAMLRDFGEVAQLQVSRKGPADFVSSADKRSERTLKTELAKARPGFGFILEEGGTQRPAEGETRQWIIDPLDGTTNFLHGIGHFAISIAVEQDGQVLAGVIYNPVNDEMYWAEKGQGAYMNDRRLRVSGRRRLEQALIATGVPFLGHGDGDRFMAELGGLMPHIAGIRRFGAASLDLAYVAAGRYDGFWERSLNSWDVAAGVLLVQEAGGFVTEIEGGRNPVFAGSILASNSSLHTHLAKRLVAERPTVAASQPGQAGM